MTNEQALQEGLSATALQQKEAADLAAAKEVINEKAKEPKELTKQVELKPASDLHYKFDDVVVEGQGQLSFKAFDFGVFKGMDTEIQAIAAAHNKIEAEQMYSNEYKETKRIEALIEVMEIKEDYKQKALVQIENLRKPEMTVKYLASSDIQANMLKRLNNTLIYSQLIKNCNVEDMINLFEDNKDNLEIRTLLKAEALKLVAVSKGAKKDQALKLKAAIKEYELEITNEDYFDELDSIERSIHYVFSHSDRYEVGLENGFETAHLERIFS